MNPLVLSAFVEAVQRGLEARGEASATEVIRMPATTVTASRYYTSAANGGHRARSALVSAYPLHSAASTASQMM